MFENTVWKWHSLQWHSCLGFRDGHLASVVQYVLVTIGQNTLCDSVNSFGGELLPPNLSFIVDQLLQSISGEARTSTLVLRGQRPPKLAGPQLDDTTPCPMGAKEPGHSLCC